MDGWIDIQQRSSLNLIVTSLQGPSFLWVFDWSGKMKDATLMFEVLKDAIEEACPHNVVHVFINATPLCRVARLMVQS